jgi:hypothetical protein
VRGIGDTTTRFERSCKHTHYTQTHYKRPIVDAVAPSRLNKKAVMVRNAMLLDKRQITLMRRIHKQFHEKLNPFRSPEGVELFPRYSELPQTTLEGTRMKGVAWILEYFAFCRDGICLRKLSSNERED